jgi:hypothetical protein
VGRFGAVEPRVDTVTVHISVDIAGKNWLVKLIASTPAHWGSFQATVAGVGPTVPVGTGVELHIPRKLHLCE